MDCEPILKSTKSYLHADPLTKASTFLVLPVAAATVAECCFRDLHRFLLIGLNLPGYLTWMPAALSLILLAPVAMIGFASGKEAIASTCAGFAVAFFVTSFMRGSYTWPGTFDYATISASVHRVVFITPLVLATPFAFTQHPIMKDSRVAKVAASLVLTGLAWTWLHNLTGGGYYSAYVYSRHLTSSLIAVVFFGSLGYVRFVNR